jgi:hypothetical protein
VKWLWTVLLTLAVAVAAMAGIGALLPQSHSVTRSAHFNQPPEAVWEVIAGPPTWRSDVRNFEVLAPRNGNRTWKELDAHGNAVIDEAIEETPPFRLVSRLADSGRSSVYWIDEITPEPDGCTLRITENAEIPNPFHRFLSRFVFGDTAGIDGLFSALRAKFGDKRS